jgi:hypothetical protein
MRSSKRINKSFNGIAVSARIVHVRHTANNRSDADGNRGSIETTEDAYVDDLVIEGSVSNETRQNIVDTLCEEAWKLPLPKLDMFGMFDELDEFA